MINFTKRFIWNAKAWNKRTAVNLLDAFTFKSLEDLGWLSYRQITEFPFNVVICALSSWTKQAGLSALITTNILCLRRYVFGANKIFCFTFISIASKLLSHAAILNIRALARGDCQMICDTCSRARKLLQHYWRIG